MNMELYVETLKPYVKKAGIVLMLGAVVAGAGGWYKHNLDQEKHAQKERAWSMMITAQAQQRAIPLIEESAVRSLAAEAIGQAETAIEFREITLRDMAQAEEKHREKAAKHRWGAKDKPEKEMTARPKAAEYQTIAAPVPQAAPAPAITFRPAYKVSCRVDQVKYKLYIDAVSGEVLRVKCDT